MISVRILDQILGQPRTLGLHQSLVPGQIPVLALQHLLAVLDPHNGADASPDLPETEYAVSNGYGQSWYDEHLWYEMGGYAERYYSRNCGLHSILSDGQLLAELDLAVCNAYKSLLPQIVFYLHY
jgi:hypothetical protein